MLLKSVACRRNTELRQWVTRVNYRNALCMLTALCSLSIIIVLYCADGHQCRALHRSHIAHDLYMNINQLSVKGVIKKITHIYYATDGSV